MFWFISFLISVLILGTLLFFSYPQEKVRDSYNTYWCKCSWVDTGDKRIPVPVWVVIVSGLISIIPVMNLICSVLAVGAYWIQYGDKDDADGYELIDHRMVLRAPYLKWFKWLNKEI